MKILVLNGPNINMLGIREPEVYGSENYKALVSAVAEEAKELGIAADVAQSNIEGEIVTHIQNALGVYDALVINPGAYTHTSISILDALKAVNLPAVEVHLSNIHSREKFRSKSMTAAGCVGIISGLGIYGYRLAMRGVVQKILKSKKKLDEEQKKINMDK